jgi:hypothetical protein
VEAIPPTGCGIHMTIYSVLINLVAVGHGPRRLQP